VVERRYQRLGGNQFLSVETISNIVRSHGRPSKPPLLVPSLKVDPIDNFILAELNFEAYRRAVAAEATKLRRVALKCLLEDPWAVEKPLRVCQMIADKQVQAFFDNIEDNWRARNSTLFLKPDTRKAKIDEVDEKTRQPGPHTSGSGLKVDSLGDATICQYQYLVDKLIYQMTPTAEERSQTGRDQLLASINSTGMRKHLELLRQWNVVWQRQADDRAEGCNWPWHHGRLAIDLWNTDVTCFPVRKKDSPVPA
jgi:hypothetical protein